ncbi:MAG: ACP S-malonyltransferase [Acidimicrobiales bacterium]|nr:ACP S-malonyltransferase [Acidimicrobiales bacterium]
MLAFTFPGQGSQRPGMGLPWTDLESWELVGEASEAAGRDVAQLLLSADAEQLRDTRNAQLATFVLSLVVLDAVERTGLLPSSCAGHSLGEYSALTAAGALAFDEGVRLVVERADAMHAAGEERPGTMAAVLGLDDDLVDVACRRADGEVWVANFNGPGQVVIAGDHDDVTRAGEEARALGAKRVMALPVAGAFHTPFMAPARDRLRKAIAETRPRDTEVPVVANVDGLVHSLGAEWCGLLSAQLCSPVRWRQTLQTLAAIGATTFVELGPGGVLTGLAKRTIPDALAVAVAGPDDLDALLETLSRGEPVHLAPVEGEHLFTLERLVVSSAAGLFRPVDGLGEGAVVAVGDLVGRVGEHEVRSPFAGRMQALVAADGERVTASQPVAWLRTVQG